MLSDHTEPADMPESASSTSDLASFAWEDTDATGLAPSNLPLTKAQRAWERRPQSPFSKRRFKVGKIFKRHASQQHQRPLNIASGLATSFNVNIRQPGNAGTPVKAVKKLRVARDSPNGIGSGAVVSDWECRGSPVNRRIVTRSSLGQEELIALGEEQEQKQEQEQDLDVVAEADEDVEGTCIEILNQDGTERIGDPAAADDDEWEDESATEVGEDVHVEEQAWDRCGEDARAVRESMSPSDALVTSPLQRQEADKQDQAQAEEPVESIKLDSILQERDDAEDSSALQCESKSETEHELPLLETVDETSPVAAQVREQVVLPEGFVSPAVARRRRPISQVKQSNQNRRRTLPNNFAASAVPTPPQPETLAEAVISSTEDGGEADDEAPGNETLHKQTIATYHLEDRKDEEEVPAIDMQQDADLPEKTVGDATPEPFRYVSTEPNTPTTESLLSTEYQQQKSLLSPSKMASSPIPTIEGSHPRLPLRRSPRRQRQSSSPIKRKSILKQTLRKPHLVAFTPVKVPPQPDQKAEPLLRSSPLPVDFSGITSPAFVHDDLPVRSSSAPPEEPQMSPRKPKQPRISDDTALLEAFLKRASESKTDKRVSDTARRESLEHRRNSDTVRQALASPSVKSPAPSDVLADLDPNSPSPRKTSGITFHSSLLDRGDLELQQDPIRDDEDELAAGSGPPKRFSSRKSGRVKKKPETLPSTTYDGKTKIQIRTNSEGVVLRKTEARELAIETRKNTKLNKSGAVLPPLRLTKMAAEKKKGSSQEIENNAIDVEEPPAPHKRGITWAEQIASFYGGDDVEMSTMMDELGNEQANLDPTAPDKNMLKDGEMSSTSAPPVSQTPSKPKIRRLKAPKPTASTIAKPPLPLERNISKGEDEQEIEIKPKATRRKVSRIATPAKVKGKMLLGQSEDDHEETAQLGELKPRPTPMPASAQKYAAAHDSEETLVPVPKTVATKKKAVGASKLPAPAASALPGPVHSSANSIANASIAAGKENLLTASPPKKRSAKVSTVAAAAPLKLGDAKGLAWKFDQSKAAFKPADNDSPMTPGMMSPAKKAPRMMPARSTISNERRQQMEAAPGLASPAKKRTRSMAS